MAEVQQTQVDPVAGLVDIPFPQPVSLWPQTWPLRIAMVVLLVAAVAALWRFLHYRHINRYRREALGELGRIERKFRIDDAAADFVAGLALLVRRTALAAFPREEVAPLAGSAWLAFLDRTSNGLQFSQGPGRLLVDAPYQRMTPGNAELTSLAGLVRDWIRGHHG